MSDTNNGLGNIDQCSPQVVAGWIANPNTPEQSLLIDVYVEEQLYVTLLANKLRKDISYVGGGNHGFHVSLPGMLFNKWAEVNVVIKIHGTNEVALKAAIKPDMLPLNIVNINDTGNLIGETLSGIRSGLHSSISATFGSTFSKDGFIGVPEPEVPIFMADNRDDVSKEDIALLSERKLLIRPPKIVTEKFARIGPSGAVITQKGDLILESVEGVLSQQQIYVNGPKELPIGEVISGKHTLGICERQINLGLYTGYFEAVAIQKVGCWNYAIWTTECLPRAFIAMRDERLSSIPIVLKVGRRPNERILDTIKESIRYLGIDESRVLLLEESWCRIETLHVPTATDPRLQSRVSLELLHCTDRIRANVEKEVGIVGGRRIYISRKDAKIRRISNEDAICQLLQNDFGFEVFTLSNLKFSEQVALFASATVIVGPHGAGLANCIFNSGNNATLVEITTSDIFNRRIFRDICCVRGIRYGIVAGRMTDPGKGDFHADIDDIKAAVIWAIQ